MAKLDKNNTGLVFGMFLALLHLLWAVLIWVIPTYLQKFLDWIFKLHALEPIWKITTMTVINAALLVIITFIFGYILGWVFAWIWDWKVKK